MHKKIIYVIFSFVLFVGCAEQSVIDQDSPFDRFGGIKEEESTPPKSFAIKAPRKGAQFHPLQPIRCKVELVVDRKEDLPTLLHVALKRGHATVTTLYPELVGGPSNGRYEFEVEISAPEKEGRYSLRADTTDHIRPEGGGPIETKVVETASDEVHFEVINK